MAKFLTVLLTFAETKASGRNKVPLYAGPHVFLMLTIFAVKLYKGQRIKLDRAELLS